MALIDVAIDDSGDLPEGGSYFVTGAALVAQRIRMRLARFLGEERLNVTLGLPYLDWVAQKMTATLTAEIGALIRREVETIPGVARLSDWTAAYEARTRTMTIGGTVLLDSGDALTLSVLPSGERNNRSAPLILLHHL